jgi:hypothetical protein
LLHLIEVEVARKDVEVDDAGIADVDDQGRVIGDSRLGNERLCLTLVVDLIGVGVIGVPIASGESRRNSSTWV